MLYASEELKICDFHVHVGERIGGLELAHSFRKLSELARKAGVVAIGAFVTEEPGMSLTRKFEMVKAAAARDFEGFVHWHLTPVEASYEEVAPLLAEGCDLKFYTTYREAGLYCSYQKLEEWMLAFPKTRFLVHCEDDAIVTESSARHSFTHPYMHCKRRPESAEIKAVETVLDLAVKHQHPVHIVHVSSPRAAILINEARSHYQGITSETAPHYLIYNEDRLKEQQGHRYLCSPPYRPEPSRGTLVELLQDGYFDIVASDHCPFEDKLKDRYVQDLDKVPNGIPGMETLFSSLHEHFVETGKLKIEQLRELTSTRPAQMMNFREGG